MAKRIVLRYIRGGDPDQVERTTVLPPDYVLAVGSGASGVSMARGSSGGVATSELLDVALIDDADPGHGERKNHASSQEGGSVPPSVSITTPERWGALPLDEESHGA